MTQKSDVRGIWTLGDDGRRLDCDFPRGEDARRPHSLVTGRETFLAPVEWRAGWPVANGGRRISLGMELQLHLPDSATSTSTPTSAGDIGQHLRTSWRDDFCGSDLQLTW